MASDYLEFATIIAREAGELLKKELPKEHQIDFKGEIDIVTEVDKMSEEWLMRRIGQNYPHHDIMTEESAGFHCGSAYRWIIDPLDGTTNYAHGYPVFCVSVALEIAAEIHCGAIYSPMTEEMFTAEKQGGAFINGKLMHVSTTAELSRGLLATGFPYDIRESKDNNINYFIGMALQAQALRRAGSAALDLAYVAAGRFDGFWELKLKPWDTAAGWLMVMEAGGEVSDLYGHGYDFASPHIVATNGMIHDKMIAALSSSEEYVTMAAISKMNWQVYIIVCTDNSLYTGITTDVERRFGEHKSGRGAKYFRGRQPVQVIYLESGHTLSSAMRKEARIKRMERSKKCLLISADTNEIIDSMSGPQVTLP